MKSVTALFLSLLILISVPTQAMANEGLKYAFDELNYSLSIEWDQNNKEFYDSALEKFKTTVQILQAQGLSNKEIIDFSVAQVKNKKFGADIKYAFDVIEAEKLNQTEAQDLMLEVINKTYNKGASWEVYPGGFITYGFVAIGILILAAALSASES
jgi:hypothetical protein